MVQDLGKFLVKLSEGDIIATEPKYLRNCLTRLKNAYLITTKKSAENSAAEIIQGILYYFIYKDVLKTGN